MYTHHGESRKERSQTDSGERGQRRNADGRRPPRRPRAQRGQAKGNQQNNKSQAQKGGASDRQNKGSQSNRGKDGQRRNQQSGDRRPPRTDNRNDRNKGNKGKNSQSNDRFNRNRGRPTTTLVYRDLVPAECRDPCADSAPLALLARQPIVSNRDDFSKVKLHHKGCIFCGKNDHHSSACTNCKNMYWLERWHRVHMRKAAQPGKPSEQLPICYNCLELGHATPTCKKPVCQELCPKEDNRVCRRAHAAPLHSDHQPKQ